MKKNITSVIITVFIIANAVGNFVFAKETNLIKNVEIHFKSAETPNRLEVHFDLTEPIDLSQDSSNIIFEYFIMDATAGLEPVNYKKDKSWAGYLNVYDNYPLGENKYSSGTENSNYSDEIPAATIYTSVKSGESIDTAQVAAVKVTVLRADGSGEEFTIYRNVSNINKSTGIRLQSTALELPVNTILITDELTDGNMYEMAKEVLTGSKSFVVFDIKLEAENRAVAPNGNVQLNIPIPQSFTSPYLKVYRIDDDGTKTPYTTSIMTIDGIQHAAFETDHFSTYALLEIAVYPYVVEYYSDTIAQSNLIDSIEGSALFAEGHQLTVGDIAIDLGESWFDLKKPAAGYNNGIVQGGYPVISQTTENNKVKVLYKGGSITSQHTITIEYRDISDNTIAEKKFASVEYGAPYNTTAPAISGYRYIETIVNGVQTTEEKTVVIDSVKANYAIIFRYNLDRPTLNRITHNWYIKGYDNNTIGPDDTLTRAETAMIFYRLITNVDKDIKEPRKVFRDIDLEAWYAKAVTYLYDYDIISGYDDTTYHPDSFITRAEIAKLSSMFDNLEIPVTNTFSDVPRAHWAYNYIASSVHHGWVQGYEDGSFYPDNYATRAEIISSINKVLNRRVRAENFLPGLRVWADVPNDHWAYADIMEASHTHTFTRENEMDDETWINIMETGTDAAGDE